MNRSEANKFLIVKAGVVLNPFLDDIAVKLDTLVFAPANHIAYITSGIRTGEDQLRIIRQYLLKKRIADPYINAPAATLTSKIDWNGMRIYSWQLAWSKLLNAGIIINPPMEAEVLMDYVNSAGVNKKWQKIPPSIHFYGRALDIGGAANGISDETAIVKQAIADKLIPEITGIVIERENNCLHLNLKES